MRAAAARPRPASGYFNDKPLATPATRKLARDLSVDLRARAADRARRAASTKDDVRDASRARRRAVDASPRCRPSAARGRDRAGARAASRPVARPPQRPARGARPASPGMRRSIAQKMPQSKHTAAHFTFVEECDVTRAQGAARAPQARRPRRQGVKLTLPARSS